MRIKIERDHEDHGTTGKDNNANGTTESTGETVKTGDTAPIALPIFVSWSQFTVCPSNSFMEALSTPF